jgi:hypothetical protein
MFVAILLLLVPFLILSALYARFKRNSHYWPRLGVRQPPSNSFPLGNTPMVCATGVLGYDNVNNIVLRQYNMFKGDKGRN